MNKAIFAGSFDPITGGHLDIIEKAVRMFDELIIVVANNSNKKCLFTIDERIEFVKNATSYLNNNISIIDFDGLIVDLCYKLNVSTLVRGVRNVADFEYEINMADINEEIEPDIQTIFIPAAKHNSHISSSVVKELAKYGKTISYFCTEKVNIALEEKFKK